MRGKLYLLVNSGDIAICESPALALEWSFTIVSDSLRAVLELGEKVLRLLAQLP